jgi:hypothetical protein
MTNNGITNSPIVITSTSNADVDNFYEANRSGVDLMEVQLPEDSFVALHKDILLTPTGLGTYDRVIQGDDYILQEGLASYACAVRFALSTMYNEMGSDPMYANWGNRAWFYLKSTLTELHELGLTSEITNVLNGMNRTNQVNNVDLNKTYPEGTNGPASILIDVLLTSISDEILKGTEEMISYGI